MSVENIENVIKQIEDDISYFSALGFMHLADKFKRDLTALKQLLNK